MAHKASISEEVSSEDFRVLDLIGKLRQLSTTEDISPPQVRPPN